MAQDTHSSQDSMAAGQDVPLTSFSLSVMANLLAQYKRLVYEQYPAMLK